MDNCIGMNPKVRVNQLVRLNKGLQLKIETLEEEICSLKEQICKPDIPDQVKIWMSEYSLYAWECFWCFEHGSWIVELDSSFPFCCENCKCKECD